MGKALTGRRGFYQQQNREKMWLITRKELTNSQIEAIQTPINRNKIFIGAPGSGKTLILVYRLEYVLNELKVRPERARLFVYTTALSEYIKSSITNLGLPTECVTNFDKWCYAFFRSRISSQVPREGNLPDYKLIKEKILEYIEKEETEAIFDVVLVDEGQDLTEISYKILARISKHVTVCLDEKQQIYVENSNIVEIKKSLNVRDYEISNILEGWRCSPHIVKIAAEFIEDKEERQYFLSQNRKPLIENELPYIAISTDYTKANKKLYELIKERLLLNDSVAILVSKNSICGAIGNYLQQNGIEAEFYKEIDFTTSNPKVMTIHSAKGLTFDSVFMPSLLSSNFSKFPEAITRRMLFVGITRAIKWLYMDFNPEKKIEILSVINSLEMRKELTIENLDKTETAARVNVDVDNPLDLL